MNKGRRGDALVGRWVLRPVVLHAHEVLGWEGADSPPHCVPSPPFCADSAPPCVAPNLLCSPSKMHVSSFLKFPEMCPQGCVCSCNMTGVVVQSVSSLSTSVAGVLLYLPWFLSTVAWKNGLCLGRSQCSSVVRKAAMNILLWAFGGPCSIPREAEGRACLGHPPGKFSQSGYLRFWKDAEM